jgi:NADH-quinone oxidoreductase subunit C
MDFHAIHDRLRVLRAPGLLGSDEPRPADPKDKHSKGRAGDPFLLVDAQKLVDFLVVCRDDARLTFEILADLSATDPAKDAPDLWINVNLLSVRHKHRLAVKCTLAKQQARMPSSVRAYRAAQWAERECGEMFGIEFTGHPDPRNILLPDDWVGAPLRKDYEFPKEYHGISCV